MRFHEYEIGTLVIKDTAAQHFRAVACYTYDDRKELLFHEEGHYLRNV
ncbi:5-dehydro-4-deoxy-D-glucuronate isomerase [Bacillus velezensis]|nr:protein of unknown function [Bacillus velezensis UCMB5033]CUX95101.1 conserved protein of unknown function [Bacillus velezensis]